MKKDNLSPIFIFSLPRSGSTLLQKLIASSEKVSTISEPWFLLPLVYMTKENGVMAEYSHKKAKFAMKNLLENMNPKVENFNKFTRQYANSVYNHLADDKAIYFLDKTPRYFLIISEIVEIFPDAKFVFLFRNPLAQYSSKMNTRRKGNFQYMYSSNIDTGYGPNLLVEGYNKIKDISLSISYEELVNDTQDVVEKLGNYLNIEFPVDAIERLFRIDLKGDLGDPNLLNNTSGKISNSSLDKWKGTFNTVYRKFLAKKYLNTINDVYFERSNTTRNKVLQELNEIKTSFKNNVIMTPFDMIQNFRNWFIGGFKPYLAFSKLSKDHKWINKKYLN